MPYITQTDRTILDPHINELAKQIVSILEPSKTDAAFSGVLNYTITRLIMQVIKLKFVSLRYWIIATTTGVLHNVADEFYRRMASPYEDIAIEKNGDVDLYQDFDKAMIEQMLKIQSENQNGCSS